MFRGRKHDSGLGPNSGSSSRTTRLLPLRPKVPFARRIPQIGVEGPICTDCVRVQWRHFVGSHGRYSSHRQALQAGHPQHSKLKRGCHDTRSAGTKVNVAAMPPPCCCRHAAATPGSVLPRWARCHAGLSSNSQVSAACLKSQPADLRVSQPFRPSLDLHNKRTPRVLPRCSSSMALDSATTHVFPVDKQPGY